MKPDWRAMVALVGLLVIAVQSCSGPSGDPERLAKEITGLAQGTTALRNEYSEVMDWTLTLIEATHSLQARLIEDEILGGDPSWRIYLLKRDCNGFQKADQCRDGAGIPVRYIVDPHYVDPATIRVTAPDVARGESGFAVQFGCAIIGTIKCISFAEIGGFADYTNCKTRACSLAEAETEAAAASFSKTVANLGRQSIECPGEAACEEIAAKFRQLIDVASDRRHIRDIREIEPAIARIDKAANGALYVESSTSGVEVVIGATLGFADRAAYRSEAVRLDPDGTLHLELKVCEGDVAEDCVADDAWEQKITHVSLAGLNPSHIYLHDLSRVTRGGSTTHYEGRSIVANCRVSQRECAANMGIAVNPIDIFVPCPDKKTCKAVLSDLAGLASFATTPGFAAWRKQRRAESFEPTPIDSDKSAKRAVKRVAQALSDRVADYAIGDEHYFVRQRDAEWLDTGTLRIAGVYCVGNKPCADEDDDRSWNTEFELADIDKDQVAIAEIVSYSHAPVVSLACSGKKRCITDSLDQVPRFVAPKTSLGCKDVDSCYAIARDLRGLAAYAVSRPKEPKVSKPGERRAENTVPHSPAGDPALSRATNSKADTLDKASERAPKRNAGKGRGIVGVWQFESPFPNGWVTEFKANGTFVFTNPNSRTEGKYTAKDGKWSQSAPQFNFSDSGTYRFLDDDTLELTGKLGASVWKRKT